MYDSTKHFANRGLPRNKKPLKNIVYTVKVIPASDLKTKQPITQQDLERLSRYKFKELGYIVLQWNRQEKRPIKFGHGFITPAELKEKIGLTQWAKFCQGKREFIIQRRVDGRNVKKKGNK